MQPPSSRTNAQWWNAFLHVLPSRTPHLFETYMTHMTTLYSVQFIWSFLSAIGWLVLRSWYVSTRLLKTTTFPLSWQTQQSFLSWPLAILRITLGIRPKIRQRRASLRHQTCLLRTAVGWKSCLSDVTTIWEHQGHHSCGPFFCLTHCLMPTICHAKPTLVTSNFKNRSTHTHTLRLWMIDSIWPSSSYQKTLPLMVRSKWIKWRSVGPQNEV